METWSNPLLGERSIVFFPVEEEGGTVKVVRTWNNGRGSTIDTCAGVEEAQYKMQKLFVEEKGKEIFLSGHYLIDAYVWRGIKSTKIAYEIFFPNDETRAFFSKYALLPLFKTRLSEVTFVDHPSGMMSVRFHEILPDRVEDTLRNLLGRIYGKFESGVIALFYPIQFESVLPSIPIEGRN